MQELYSSARAEPKLVKMLREEIMLMHFYSDSRLAFPRSDNTSLSRITLMFTTLHSIAVVLAAPSYCHMILRNSVNRLHCADVYYIAQSHGSSGGAALLLRGTVQFRKRTLHLTLVEILHT